MEKEKITPKEGLRITIYVAITIIFFAFIFFDCVKWYNQIGWRGIVGTVSYYICFIRFIAWIQSDGKPKQKNVLEILDKLKTDTDTHLTKIENEQRAKLKDMSDILNGMKDTIERKTKQ